MSTMTALPKDSPIMLAWERYKLTSEYANTLQWTAVEEHRQGSLWAAFVEGWQAATVPASAAVAGAGAAQCKCPPELCRCGHAAQPSPLQRLREMVETTIRGSARPSWQARTNALRWVLDRIDELEAAVSEPTPITRSQSAELLLSQGLHTDSVPHADPEQPLIDALNQWCNERERSWGSPDNATRVDVMVRRAARVIAERGELIRDLEAALHKYRRAAEKAEEQVVRLQQAADVTAAEIIAETERAEKAEAHVAQMQSNIADLNLPSDADLTAARELVAQMRDRPAIRTSELDLLALALGVKEEAKP